MHSGTPDVIGPVGAETGSDQPSVGRVQASRARSLLRTVSHGERDQVLSSVAAGVSARFLRREIFALEFWEKIERDRPGSCLRYDGFRC
jgi:hypothetical protein